MTRTQFLRSVLMTQLNHSRAVNAADMGALGGQGAGDGFM